MEIECAFDNERSRNVFIREVLKECNNYSYDQFVYECLNLNFSFKLSKNKINFNGDDNRILEIKKNYESFNPKEKEFTFYLKCRLSKNVSNSVLTTGNSEIGKYVISICKPDDRHYSNIWHSCYLIFKVTAYDDSEAIIYGEKEGLKILPVLSVILDRCLTLESDGMWGTGESRSIPKVNLLYDYNSNSNKVDSSELIYYSKLADADKTNFERACRGYQMFLEVGRKYPVLGGVCLRSVFDILYGQSKAKNKLKNIQGKLYSNLSYYPHNDIMPEKFLQEKQVSFRQAHQYDIEFQESQNFSLLLRQVKELARNDLLAYLAKSAK